MAKIDLEHFYNVPLDEYLRMVFQPSEEELNDLTDLPNVQEREEVERYEDDKIVRTTVRYFAVGFIPPLVRQHLKPHMLSWLEHSTYSKEGKCWDWWIEPHFFKHLLQCEGRMSLYADGSRTRRETRGVLKIKVPIIGDPAERLILDHLKKNMDEEIRMFHETLERLSKKKKQ